MTKYVNMASKDEGTEFLDRLGSILKRPGNESFYHNYLASAPYEKEDHEVPKYKQRPSDVMPRYEARPSSLREDDIPRYEARPSSSLREENIPRYEARPSSLREDDIPRYEARPSSSLREENIPRYEARPSSSLREEE